MSSEAQEALSGLTTAYSHSSSEVLKKLMSMLCTEKVKSIELAYVLYRWQLEFSRLIMFQHGICA